MKGNRSTPPTTSRQTIFIHLLQVFCSAFLAVFRSMVQRLVKETFGSESEYNEQGVSDSNLKTVVKLCKYQLNGYGDEKRFFEFSFNKKYRDRGLNEYLPFVLAKYKEIKDNDKVVKLFYHRDGFYGDDDSYGGGGGGVWVSINFDHPATLNTLAMDPEKKKFIIDDLHRYLVRKEFYKKVNKAWKRGYLLFGPPGTGKSSLIAAIANYLKFDIYDLDLTTISSNWELRKILASTTNRSIIVIEDIDCIAELYDRKKGVKQPYGPHSKLTDLLDFMDDPSYGDERIIIFTTNYRDRLDAALLRRMDMHIHMSYCTNQGFKILASNYLNIHDHMLFGEIEDLIATVEVTSAEVAEELIKSEDADVALAGVVNFLKRTKMKGNEIELDKVVKVYTRRGMGGWHSMKLEQLATFADLGTDPENKGIISDLLGFVRDEESYKRIGKAWKRGYLLYDSPGTDRLSLIAAMAKSLEFDIYDVDPMGLSSISELTNVLVSINNRSLIAIKDFDHWVGMLPNAKNELTLSGLLKILNGLLSSCGDERIIVLTANHNHMDRVDAALLRPLNMDLYIHTSSRQPIALPNDGGEIVRFDSSEQQSSVDFVAIDNSAYQRDVLVSNSEEKKMMASRRQCMHESVHSLVDSSTSLSSMDLDALDNSVHLVRAYQSDPILFNSEKKDTREGLNIECLTKSVLSLDDSSKQKLLPDVDATENKAHLVRAYQSYPVVSLSDNKNRGEALKRECITKSILGLEDLQPHSGGRPDDAANSFGAIYDPGIHTTHSLAQNSFEVLEALPTWKRPNDSGPLLSLGRLALEGCVQEEKSQDLPRLMQINGVERRVTKSPRYLGGLTAQSANSSRWLIGLPNGRHIVVLNPLEQPTKNVAHVARPDQCSPTVPLPEKKMVRRTLKRKYRIMSVIFEIHQQNFGKRCEGTVKSFHVMRICSNHGINRVSTVKRIHKQHRINRWPFRQKLATRKGYSLGKKRPYEVSNLSVVEVSIFKSSCMQHRVYWLPCQIKKNGQQAFDATNNIAHLVKADQGIPTMSYSEMEIKREALKSKCSGLSLEDLPQHYGGRHADATKGLGDSLTWMLLEVLESLPLGEQSIIRHFAQRRTLTHKHCVKWKKSQDLPRSLQMYCSAGLDAQSAVGLQDGGYIISLSEKKIVGKTLKRKCRTKSVFSLEDHQQHGVRRWEDAAKSLGRKRICRQLGIQHVSRAKGIHRQHVIHRWPFQQNWATMKVYSGGDKRPAEVISLSTDGKIVSRLQLVHIPWLGKFLPRPSALPGGGEILGPIALLSSEFPATNNRAHIIRQDQSGSSTSHPEEEIPGGPEDLEGIDRGISLKDLQQLFAMKREDAAKILNVSVSTLKRICRQHGIKPWPYRATKKAVKKPPDQYRGMNTSPTCKTLSTYGSNPASSQPMPIISHTTGSSEDRRNLLASQEEHLLQGRVSRPIYGTISSCTDPAPIQPMPTIPHTTGSSEDSRNLLALPEEPLPSQLMPTIPPTMDGLEDWSDYSAFLVNPFREGHASGSIDCTVPSCSDPALSQPMPTIAHAMPAIPFVMPLLTERQDMGSMKLKATYGDTTIKLQLPPMFGISELKEEVSKRRESGLGGYKIEYKDVDGIWTLIACNEDIRDYLELLTSLGNQVIQLRVRDIPNTTTFCQFCGSLNG